MERKPPAYRLHKPSGLAVVRLSGRDVYLGRHDTPESREAYRREVAAWEARGRTPLDKAAVLTVDRFADAYLRHAKVYYAKRGEPTTRYGVCDYSLRYLRELFGSKPLVELTAADLRTYSNHLATQTHWGRPLTRRSCNQYLSCIQGAIRWAHEQGWIGAAEAWSLCGVRKLQAGRSAARETEPVSPVPPDVLAGTLEVLDAGGDRGGGFVLAALIRFQLFTGARAQEVCCARRCDFDRSGAVWVYTPQEHKNEHRGKLRRIAVGPRAQAVLAPYWDAAESDGAPLFMTRQKRAWSRKSYATILGVWLAKHKIPHWSPHQLRHSWLTQVRREYGLDAARAVAGQASVDTTEIYLERDLVAASRVAAEIG